ncbi:MAG TPA: hypothetical protein VNE41_07705 [Chitinophagaceae bacterium]|nr:hypothetical protein [Chitinophagaceae bacterium]
MRIVLQVIRFLQSRGISPHWAIFLLNNIRIGNAKIFPLPPHKLKIFIKITNPNTAANYGQVVNNPE